MALLERLTMLATPETANGLLRTALLNCKRRFVPEGGAELEEFVQGALFRATRTHLGEDAADALMDDLAVLVKAAVAATTSDDDSHVRMTIRPVPEHKRPSSPTLPVDASDDLPPLLDFEEPPARASITSPSIRVIIASRSEDRCGEVAAALGPEAEVQRVSDVFELVDLAAAPTDGAVVVLVDRDEAIVRTSTLAAASDELPATAHVVLWGDGSASNDELPDVIPAPESWTRISGEISVSDIATVIRRVGRGTVA